MKRIVHDDDAKDNLLHIETELGIVNIRVKLKDFQGNRVESIEILPSRTEPVRTIPEVYNVRLIGKSRR